MAVYEVDPIRDPRWHDFLQRDSRASVFHTPGWLQALAQTYGYEPVALTTCAPRRELTNAMVFCRIHSWLTGRRLVSLPFSDHCDPLVNHPDDLGEISQFLNAGINRDHLRYVELRPQESLDELAGRFSPLRTLCFHALDLRPAASQLFDRLHKDCIRRKIRRAHRESLTYERGTSPALLHQFYKLFVATRKHHGLPPSPFAWFQSLKDCMGPALQVRIATKDDQPVAGVLSLSFKNTVFYKYGASDARFNNLGGMPFLLWTTILESKLDGKEQFDLGRSEPDNAGLIAFKDRWGSARSTITYWSSPACVSQAHPEHWKLQLAKGLCALTPAPIRIAAGNVLYRHVG